MLNEADIDFDAVTTGDLIHSINFICCYLMYPFLLVLTFVAGIHSKRQFQNQRLLDSFWSFLLPTFRFPYLFLYTHVTG